MAAVTVYNMQGDKTGSVEIDPKSIDKAVRKALLKEAYIAWQASQRSGTHATLDRGEVAGGGKKPWRQKGTGRARQGSTRSPQWVGGGRAHASSPRDYTVELPAGQRRVALMSSVRFRLQEGKILAIDGLEAGLSKPSTKVVAKLMAKIGIEGKGALFIAEGTPAGMHLSTRNLPKVSASDRRCLNAGLVLSHANILFSKAALDAFVSAAKAKGTDK